MPGHRAEPQLQEAGSSTPDASTARAGGRRKASVPVDYVSPLDAAPSAYVGRRQGCGARDRRSARTHCSPRITRRVDRRAGSGPRGAVRELDREFDTGSIERVLSSLEPVDQTTSFEHEPTTRLPMLRAEPPTTGGKRRAVKHAGGRGPLFKGFPSAPVLMGIAALAVSIGGVITVNDPQPAAAGSTSSARSTHAASALGGSSGTGTFSSRKAQVTRDNDRQAQASRRRPGQAPGRRGCRRQGACGSPHRAGRQGRGAGQGAGQEPVDLPARAGRPDRPFRPVRPVVELPHRPRLQRRDRRPDPRDRRRHRHLRRLRRLLRQQDRRAASRTAPSCGTATRPPSWSRSATPSTPTRSSAWSARPATSPAPTSTSRCTPAAATRSTPTPRCSSTASSSVLVAGRG